MSSPEPAALIGLLAQMRSTYDRLVDHDAGISILHLDAAIAALESRLGKTNDRAAAPWPNPGFSQVTW